MVRELPALLAICAFVAVLLCLAAAAWWLRTQRGAERERRWARFREAAAELEAREVGVRIAALYALQQLARESGSLQWPVADLVCAFVSQQGSAQDERGAATAAATRPRHDLQAALNVLRQRDAGRDPGDHRLDFRGADLSNCDLTGARLPGARFDGARLRGASLCRADLRDATFHGADVAAASFDRAMLQGTSFGGGGASDAKGLTRPQLEPASGVGDTRLPAALVPAPRLRALPAGAETALATQGLSKSYGRRVAVSSLDLQIQRGEVFGFLGPNGAGKTTTIRMLVGLVRPSGGRIELFGRDLGRHARDVLPRVGALIESPAFHPYLSARDNLRTFGMALGGLPSARVDEVLELVDLRERQRDRVRTFSLGMKQRLGVAIALLHDPDLVILDEPTNGLDPAGIVEMREVLRRLAAMGKTVFVSSHALPEVQQSCDRVAIIRRGELVELSPVSQLLHRSGLFQVSVEDPARALQAVRQQRWGAGARIEDGLLVTASPTGRGRELVDFLVAAELRPDAVSEREQSLESIFLALTANGEGPGR